MKWLIENVSIVPMTQPDYCIDKGYIVIEGDSIRAVGTGNAPPDEYERRMDGTDRLALPGFINAHTHAAMTLLRGYADDLPLMEWLEQKIWPLEDKLSGDDVYWGTMLALVEMIKSGTTCFADMYFFMDEAARAVAQAGMRAVLARGMVGVGPSADLAINESRTLFSRWNGAAEGRIKVILGPHAPYTCPPEYLQKVIAMARELGTGIHIHLAETAGEVADSLKLYGVTPASHLENMGMFDYPVLAAHCVHVDEKDIEILAKYKVAVVHNPESNMKLASGIAPVPQMIRAGIPVALGTDGASSNNNLDMLQELRTCALLHKVNTMDPTVIPAYQALQMATTNGAAALGIDKEVGKLEAGKKADIILVKNNEAHFIPRHDQIANLVYSGQAADIQTVVINGKIVMEDRILQTLNEAEILEKAQCVAMRLAAQP